MMEWWSSGLSARKLWCIAPLIQHSRSFVHHRVAFWFEFAARFPLRKFVTVCNLSSDFEQQFGVLNCAGKIPVRFYFITYLMIIFQIELVRAQRRVDWSR